MQAGLAELFEALDARAGRAATDARAAAGLDAQVAAAVASLGEGLSRPMVDRLSGPPPDAIGAAMARALFDAPHVSRTFGGDTTVHAYAPFRPSEALGDALGHDVDVLDAMREDGDRAAAGVLKQMRLLSWLWMRAGDPAAQPLTLFRSLFPVDASTPPQRFVRRGARLYPMFAGPGAQPEALFLPWVSGDGVDQPLGGFVARYVDDGLVTAIQRGIGADAGEAVRLLSDLVCPLPVVDDAWVRRDRWRAEGWASLTGLGTTHDSAVWLTMPLARDAVDVHTLFERAPHGGYQAASARRVFDRHAMQRATLAVRALYAELMARALTGDLAEVTRHAAVFDVCGTFQRVLQPLLDWVRSPGARRHVAETFALPSGETERLMDEVHGVWVHAMQVGWAGRPAADRPHTVATIVTGHLALLQTSLARTQRRAPDGRGAHQRVLLLFLAHYLARAPLGRLWRTNAEGGLVPTEDVVGDWFWGTWRRALDALGYEE